MKNQQKSLRNVVLLGASTAVLTVGGLVAATQGEILKPLVSYARNSFVQSQNAIPKYRVYELQSKHYITLEERTKDGQPTVLWEMQPISMPPSRGMDYVVAQMTEPKLPDTNFRRRLGEAALHYSKTQDPGNQTRYPLEGEVILSPGRRIEGTELANIINNPDAKRYFYN